MGEKDALLAYIINTSSLRQVFILRIDSNHIQWNLPRLHTWLAGFARLDMLCLLQVLMSGGAPARATELTGMLRQNSSQGMERSLRILGGQSVVLMVTYNKMRTQESRDRRIPHPLPAALAAVMLMKEALCRPFAQICVHQLYKDEAITNLHRYCLFVDRKQNFTGDQITAELRKWTKKHLGAKLGVAAWRQCSAPLRRRWAGMGPELFNLESPDAAQSGHSGAVDYRHYGVTDLSSQGLPEANLDALLSHSRRWHETLKLVPGKLLSVPYIRSWSH